MAKRKVTIAITGLNNTDNPGPGIPVIRGIRDSELFEPRIVGLAYENLEPGIYMDGMVDKTYQIPYPSVGKEALLERILEIHEKENIEVLIPNFDAELVTFMLLEADLLSVGIKMFLPTRDQFEERHKENLVDYGKKYGISVPESKQLTSLNDISSVRDDFDFPVMVKGRYYDAYVAYNTEQVISYFNKLSAKWGYPVIIQEFVKGTEVNVVALGDGYGSTIGAVPMRKQFITDKGKAWSGIVIGDEKLIEITKNIMQKTHWRGGMELEIIRTTDEKYYLIEINPRLPAWVYLAVGAGQNLPEALVQLALGENVDTFTKFKVGTMFIRYSYDMIGDISKFEQLSMNGEL